MSEAAFIERGCTPSLWQAETKSQPGSASPPRRDCSTRVGRPRSRYARRAARVSGWRATSRAWGSETRIRSRGGAVVLVDESTEQVQPANIARVDRDRDRNPGFGPVSYTHLRAHETRHDLVCR